MGERLVVKINNGGKDFAAIYYHWGAYTVDALRIVQRIINALGNYEKKSEEQIQLDLIQMCERDGGGVEYDDIQYVSHKLHCNFKHDNISRNDGLIAISPEGVSQMGQWATPIHIDLHNKVIDNYVFDSFSSYKEYCDYCDEWELDAEPYDSIKRISCDLAYFSFEELPILYMELDNSDYIVKHDDTIYTLIA